MSTSSNEVMPQVDRVIKKGEFPDWVDWFLERTFFEKCWYHESQKSELNRYCITCDESTCKYCITDGRHDHHKILTIYRHVYQDVVPLCEMENHIDCRMIQPYKCNKKWVVSLTPLPHNGSGSLIEGDGACHVCKRKLTDSDRFRFCSIACKVQSNSGRDMIGAMKCCNSKRIEEVENGKGCKRSRKGVPHRAPLA